MAEPKSSQPTVHAAQPPLLKPASATAAFRVSEWKREAIEFQQLLDRLLAQNRQPGTQAGGPPNTAPPAAPPAGGGEGGPAEVGADTRQLAAVTALPLALPLLDASDLRLATVQEELIRELAAESQLGLGRQEERQEQGTEDAPAPAAAAQGLQEQQQEQAAAAGAQPGASMGQPEQQQQQQQQQQQGGQPAAPHQMGAVAWDAAAPLVMAVPWPGHPAGPAASLPSAGGSASAGAAVAGGSEQQQQQQQQQQEPAAWEAQSPRRLQGGPPQLPRPPVQQAQQAQQQQQAQSEGRQQAGAAGEAADHMQEGRPPDEAQQQPWQAQQAQQVQQECHDPMAQAAEAMQEQQQFEQPEQGVVRHQRQQLAPAPAPAPALAPAGQGEQAAQVPLQPPQPPPQREQQDPAGSAGPSRPSRSRRSSRAQQPQHEQEQRQVEGLHGASEQPLQPPQQQQQQQLHQAGWQGDGAAAVASTAGRQQQEQQGQQEQVPEQEQAGQAGKPAQQGQQAAPLQEGEAQQQEQQGQALQERALQASAQKQQAAQAEAAEQPVGKRQRKRPRWLDDMADVAEAGVAPAQQPPAQQLPAQQLPQPALPRRRRQKQQQPLASMQQSEQEEQPQDLAQPQPGEQQQQEQQQLVPVPLPSLRPASPPADAAAAVAAAAAGPAGPAPDWEAILSSMFGQAGMFGGQQVLPLLPWPLAGDLLQLPPLLGQEGEEAEEEDGEAWGPPGGGKKSGKGGKKGGKGGGGGGGGSGWPRLAGRTAAQVAAAHVLKPERAAALEAYQQRAEAARDRRMEQRQAAARLLASIAGSELAPSLTWMLLQDARSRQLQAVARAAAEAAALEDSAGGGKLDWVEGDGEREVVLQVALHVPHSAHFVSEEWLVLGSQRLSELRDCLFCVADDNLAAVEKEENACHQGRGQPRVELRRPSAYLYVEGTFYNDLRQPGAIDYSEPIRRYNREQGIEAPPHPPPGNTRADVKTTEFSAARMQDARFDSLWLRLGSGAGNLYCHQGGCEHLLTFQDVRLFDRSCDPPLRRHYPFRLTTPQHTMIRDCEVCGAHIAKRVTYDDRAAPHTPFFWCEDCFRLMHYDEKGSAVYSDYRVFPYVQEYPANILTTQTRPRRGRGAAAAAAAAAAVAAAEHIN